MATRPLTRKQLRSAVHKRADQRIVNDIIGFALDRDVALMGEQQPANFFSDSVYLTIYHDLYKTGYNRLYEEAERWFPNSAKSLYKNCEKLRLVFRAWAETKILLGTLEDWMDAASETQLDKDPKNVNIWADSTDFQIQGKRTFGKKSSEWSFKLNAPGRRFLFLRNGKGIIIKIFGGYSPKIRDYMWIEERADWINEMLLGATLIGDNDWRIGMSSIDSRRVTIHAPHAEPKTKGENDEGLSKLTKAQQTYNAAVQRKRARVENMFGVLENKFIILQDAWAEEMPQLDALVWYATAIVNEMKRLN